jgi:hypothetical protein
LSHVIDWAKIFNPDPDHLQHPGDFSILNLKNIDGAQLVAHQGSPPSVLLSEARAYLPCSTL